jgi:hypothetical protein
LNLARVVSPGAIVTIVFVGVAAWLMLGCFRQFTEKARKLSVWDVALVGALLLGYINWLCFNQPPPEREAIPGQYSLFLSDDSAYTLAPVQMLQTGGKSIDPFCARLT